MNSSRFILVLLCVSLMTLNMAESESKLAPYMEAFYKSHVQYDEVLMAENKKIAESFVQDVKKALDNNLKDQPLSVGGVERQGSAFEGLKCGSPDEFDFTIMLRIKKRRGDFAYVEGRSVGDSLPEREKAAGYWKIELRSQDKAKVDDWDKFTEPWPGGPSSKPCLSPRRVVQRFQSVIDSRSVRAAPASSGGATGSKDGYWRSRVVNIRSRTRGNPALTVVLTKNDGKQIDVDVSPCIVDTDQRHFVPKRHPILRGKPVNSQEPYELLWMRTESQKELKAISNIDKEGGDRRKCMRVLKAALASKDTPFQQVHSSYIVKTAWLHVVKENQSKERWTGWEVLSLRLVEILQYLEDAFKNQELLSRYNEQENILSRFGDQFVRSSYGFLKGLNNKYKAGQIELFVKELGLDGSGTARRSRDEL